MVGAQVNALSAVIPDSAAPACFSRLLRAGGGRRAGRARYGPLKAVHASTRTAHRADAVFGCTGHRQIKHRAGHTDPPAAIHPHLSRRRRPRGGARKPALRGGGAIPQPSVNLGSGRHGTGAFRRQSQTGLSLRLSRSIGLGRGTSASDDQLPECLMSEVQGLISCGRVELGNGHMKVMNRESDKMVFTSPEVVHYSTQRRRSSANQLERHVVLSPTTTPPRHGGTT